MIFAKPQIVFLAVPKTGTTSLQSVAAKHASINVRHPASMKHSDWGVFERRYKPLFNKHLDDNRWTHMAVVREPIDWLGSWYRYRSRPALKGSERSTAGLSFAEFLEGYLRKSPPAYAQVGQPASLLRNPNGPAGIAHLFAYEHLPQAFAFLEQALGVTLKVPRRNVSPIRPLSAPADLCDRVRQRLSVDQAYYEAALQRRSGET